jgi:pyrimidine 5'-nucleotidase
VNSAKDSSSLRQALRAGTSLNASERVCLVTKDNVPIPGGGIRADMRLRKLWHRATYVLVKHEPMHVEQHGTHDSDVYVLVQKRSILKDYCPGKLDPVPGGVVGYGETYSENAIREMQEEMGIDISLGPLRRLFTFPYEDDHVAVWGDFYECTYRGAMRDLKCQDTEVEEVYRMSLKTLRYQINSSPDEFMPDACYAMKLYFQRLLDLQVKRKLLKGYSSGDLDMYGLRPKPLAIFFDCDDCLYFDGWKTAKLLTAKIDEWCVNHGLRPGQAYELYLQYGTALRGLLAEGYLEKTDEAIDSFLQSVHDLPIAELIPRDDALREIMSALDPSIPKYIFTASVSDHARRCIAALGIEDFFLDIIDCKVCGLETKHSRHSFEIAMKIAGVSDPERCLFLDDSLTNLRTAREIGWRSILIGTIGRDHGNKVSSEHAELELERIHDLLEMAPELFESTEIKRKAVFI